MSLKSTVLPAFYFACTLTFGALGVRDFADVVRSAENYVIMKKFTEETALDRRKEAQYQTFMARDDIYWHGGKTALEFLVAGFFIAKGIKRSRED
ncbi:hypothetical protein HYT23_01925 [Candidatus Pacearchaeota archaeon]|nr:hypothetical protein [Candidatus Pacearchaeota archaeon]